MDKGTSSGSAKGEDSNAVVCAAAARIAQEALKPDVSVESLAKLAQADAAFAMKLLSLVNSPAFSRAHKVTDISQAAAALGIRGVRTVALSMLVSSLTPQGDKCRPLRANSLRRAVGCQLIAVALNYKDTQACFSTGLFLDSGLLAHCKENVDLAVAIATSPSHHRVLRERAEGLTPHTELGAQLASEFLLPPETVEAIRSHHDDTPPAEPLAKVTWLGEAVAAVFEAPDVERARKNAISRARTLNLGPDQVESILTAIPEQVASVAEALDSDIGEVQDVEALKNDASRLLSEINQQYEGVIRKLGDLLREKESLATELREANSRLEALATTDALTQLPNRRALEDTLARCAARASRDGSFLSLLAMDVDHFKKFNDTYGHQAGDAVLVTVGRVLVEQSRKGDIPARYGGEEFSVVLPGTDAAGAQVVAERIRAAFEACETHHEGQVLKVTMSIGVATAEGAASEPVSRLGARADEALYAAKRGGRNRVAVSSGFENQAENDAEAKASQATG